MAELKKSISSFCTLEALAEILYIQAFGWAYHSLFIQQIFPIPQKANKQQQCMDSLSIKYWLDINLQLPHASLNK